MADWNATVEPPELAPEYLAPLLDCLFQIDCVYLRGHPDTSPLYDTKVVYRREPRGRERWASIPHVLARGHGDCEDLACWLAAQYVVHGVDGGARPTFTLRERPNGSQLYHILVRRSSGVVEDPSRVLGMGDPRVDRFNR